MTDTETHEDTVDNSILFRIGRHVCAGQQETIEHVIVDCRKYKQRRPEKNIFGLTYIMQLNPRNEKCVFWKSLVECGLYKPI